jgi:hypothetical protein
LLFARKARQGSGRQAGGRAGLRLKKLVRSHRRRQQQQKKNPVTEIFCT